MYDYEASSKFCRAHAACSDIGWAYVAGGAGEGQTMRNNRQAFDRWQIVPRMAHGTTERDLSVDLLGRRLRTPVLLAPVGAGQVIDPDCDLHVARAAADLTLAEKQIEAIGLDWVERRFGWRPGC